MNHTWDRLWIRICYIWHFRHEQIANGLTGRHLTKKFEHISNIVCAFWLRETQGFRDIWFWNCTCRKSWWLIVYNRLWKQEKRKGWSFYYINMWYYIEVEILSKTFTLNSFCVATFKEKKLRITQGYRNVKTSLQKKFKCIDYLCAKKNVLKVSLSRIFWWYK